MLFVTLPLLLTGCSDSHEDIYADTVAIQTQVIAQLKTVKDETTAKSAAEELSRLQAELDRIQDRAASMGAPEPEAKLKLDKQYEEQLAIGREDIQDALMNIRLQDPTLLAILKESWPALELKHGSEAE